MSAISFNPAAAAAAAAAAANKASVSDKAAPAKESGALPFVRGGNQPDAARLRGLSEFTQVNGQIPRHGANEEGFLGEVNRMFKEVKSGDLAGAQARLGRMENFELQSFFKANDIDPKIMNQMKEALASSPHRGPVLEKMDNILKGNGLNYYNNKLQVS